MYEKKFTKSKKFLAVDNVTFGLGRGECFGLLGVNGAGKTTTFKILTGDHKLTSGQAYLSNYEVTENLPQVCFEQNFVIKSCNILKVVIYIVVVIIIKKI